MKSERTIRRKVKELKKALIFPGGSEMTKPRVLWVQEMYESQGGYLSVGTSRRGVQHSAASRRRSPGRRPIPSTSGWSDEA